MSKAIRRYYWVAQAFLTRHAKIIIRTILIVLSAIAIFALFARYLPTPKHTLRLGRIGKYTSQTLPLDIRSLLSSGLVYVSDEGQVEPRLSSSWQVEDDGRTYIFTLDKTRRWQDGSSIKPEDINYNFQDVAVSRGDNTITYRLQEPFSPFFTAVSQPILKDHKLGSGEYRLTKSQISGGVLTSLTIENKVERRIYKFYPTESSSLTAFKLGEIDAVEHLSFIPEALRHDPTVLMSPEVTRPASQAVLFFNNNDLVLRSKSTRQALAYAIQDKSFGAVRAPSPISQSSWVYNDLVKTYEYDAEHARSLIGQDQKDLGTLKLELKTSLPYLELAESIASSWRETLGIQVEVKVVTSISSDFQVLLSDFTPPIDPDQYSIWHSTQPTNFTHYSNLKVDKLLEDGRRTSDPKLRKEIYQDFQRFLVEDCPAVFLFQNTTHTLTRKPIL